ncbi:aquaporin [Antrihabitans sp. YC2-6]|nr:aquaporin [Antrihabitans sp. YC2-6]
MTSTTPAASSDHPAAGAQLSNTTARMIVEGIGIFFLVFTIGASVRGGSSLAPLAIGGVLMAMIYAGGHVSGAHYNPAVTLAVLIRRRIELPDAVRYWTAQFVGGLAAAVAVRAFVPAAQGAAPLSFTGQTVAAAFLVELLFTFALCYVVLNVATSKSHPDNNFYGLAIGFTVLAGAVSVGGISGGVFNPAVALAGVAMGTFAGATLWVHITAQITAAIAAGIAFRLLNPNDK